MSILLNKQVCPSGPLTGTIIKPMSWRVLNDNKRFVNDWHTFVKHTRAWQRAHPMRKLDDWLHENYKNRMRKWWFTLSKYEQDRLFSIRNETGQYVISHFNGLKYQRGNFSMFPAGSTAITAPSEILSLDAANNSALNIDFSPPTLSAGFGNQLDGDLERTDSSGTNVINASTDWINPTTGTIGNDYEVKWNKLSGAANVPNNESYTEDVWTTISTTRYVRDSRTTSSQPHTYDLDIGDVGTSTSDVNQDYSAEAGDII